MSSSLFIKRNPSKVVTMLEFKELEKSFLTELKKEKQAYRESLNKLKNKKLIDLKVRLFDHEKRYDFYSEYKDLSPDNLLYTKESLLIKNEMPGIIEFLEDYNMRLDQALGFKISGEEESRINEEIRKSKKDLRDSYLTGKRKVRGSYKSGQISKKAMTNALMELKNRYKNEVHLKALESPEKANKDLIKSLKYDIKYKLKQRIRVLEADLADMRRQTPMEIKKSKPIIAYLTFPLPGLGQILNKQYIKGLLLLLGSFFIYLIACFRHNYFFIVNNLF